jgi:hypothetical protein
MSTYARGTQDPYETAEAMRRLAESIWRASESRRLTAASIDEPHLIGTYVDESIIPSPVQILSVSRLERQRAAFSNEGAKKSVGRSIKEQRRKIVSMDKGVKPLIDPIFTRPGEATREVVTLQPREEE